MKRLLISDMDLDGVGCIVVAMYFKEQFDKVWPADYGFENDEHNMVLLKEYDEIIMTDKSINEETHRQLEDMGKSLYLFDHHDSSAWALNLTKTKVYHDLTKKKCGTKLWFDYLREKHNKRLPASVSKFVELVNTYDCWMDESPLWEEALDLNRLLYKLWDWQADEPLHAMRGFIVSMLAKMESGKWEYDQTEEMFINDAKQRELREYKKLESSVQIRKDEGGLTFALGEMGAKISICCYWYLRNHPEVDYIIISNNFKGRNGKLHFRTYKDGIDLPNLLEGAAGHTKAAGGQVEISYVSALIDGRIKSIPYKKVNQNIIEDYPQQY